MNADEPVEQIAGRTMKATMFDNIVIENEDGN